MIKRFRIEAEESTKEEVIDSTALAVSRMIGVADQDGEWECTQDVVFQSDNGYSARMVMLFHPTPARREYSERYCDEATDSSHSSANGLNG